MPSPHPNFYKVFFFCVCVCADVGDLFTIGPVDGVIEFVGDDLGDLPASGEFTLLIRVRTLCNCTTST